MGECRVTLPSLRGDPVAGLAALETPPSRREQLESLMDSVEEVMRSEEPVVTLIVGEWGEGKTWAWRAHVKPALLERGVRVLEARASSLYEAFERASWIPSPAWRLVTSILVASGVLESVPGDYRRVVGEALGGKTVAFIDELEDLVYRGEALQEFLDALHALLDGEASVPPLHLYIAVSPAAYAKMTSWPSWRRLRRRLRVVELNPLPRGEALRTLLGMLRAATGTIPFSDARLANAIVEAAKGNLGALAAYARRVLSTYSRRGCKPLGLEDVKRILSEPLAAGLLDAGIDAQQVERIAGERGAEALKAILYMLLEPSEARGLEDLVIEVPVCEPMLLDDRVYVTREGVLVAAGGVVEDYVRESGGLVGGACGEHGRKYYILRPEHAAMIYGGQPSLASFIRDESLRRRAVRAAYRDPRLAARGLAALLCATVSCRTCEARGGGYLETVIDGLRVRVAIVARREDIHPLLGRKPHVVLALGFEPRLDYPRVAALHFDPITLIQLGALGYIAGESCGIEGVDRERLGVLHALIEAKYRVAERIVEALREEPPLLVAWLSLPYSRERVALALRLLALRGSAGPDELAELAGRLGLGGRARELEAVLHALARLGVIEKRGEVYRLVVSPVERGVLAVLRLLGGRARVEELEERMVEERPGALRLWLRLLALKGYLDAPKRLGRRSQVRLVTIEELRERASRVLQMLPEELREPPACDEEVCERAWLVSLEWLAEMLSERERGTAGGREQQDIATTTSVAATASLEGYTAPSPASVEDGARAEAARLRQFYRRLLHVHLLAPYALIEGGIEELGETIARAKRLARSGKIEEAMVILSDLAASISRPPSVDTMSLARMLDPGAGEILELMEDSVSVKRTLEKIISRRSREVVRASLARIEARVIRSARLA